MASANARYSASRSVFGNAWRNVYFAHVEGGRWVVPNYDWQIAGSQMGALEVFANSVNLNNCWSVLVLPGPTGYGDFGGWPAHVGFPAHQLSVYITNTSSFLEFAIGFDVRGEFGEVGNAHPRLMPSGNYGMRTRIGNFTNW